MEEPLGKFLTEGFENYLKSIPDEIASEAYALSIWISDESDLWLQGVVIAVGVHTESQFQSRLREKSSNENEARWNFSVWGDVFERFAWNKNNYQIVLGEDRSLSFLGGEFIEGWLRDRDLWGFHEREFEDAGAWDEALTSGGELFWRMVGKSALKLRTSGLLEGTFGERDPNSNTSCDMFF